METRDYNIGGLTVEMTEAQAERWNAGQLIDEEEETITVRLPAEYEQGSHLRDGEIVMHTPRMISFGRTITLADAWEEWEACLDGNLAELLYQNED